MKKQIENLKSEIPVRTYVDVCVCVCVCEREREREREKERIQRRNISLNPGFKSYLSV